MLGANAMKLPPLAVIKGMWRDQVFDDPELTASAFKLAYGLANFITMKKSKAKYNRTGRVIVNPSQATLAEVTDLSADTVRDVVAQLIERGHLKRIKRGNQYTGSNKYRIVVKADGENP